VQCSLVDGAVGSASWGFHYLQAWKDCELGGMVETLDVCKAKLEAEVPVRRERMRGGDHILGTRGSELSYVG